jgi:hypothetical protein
LGKKDMGEEGSRRSSEIDLPRSRYRGSIIVGSRKCDYGKRQVCAWKLKYHGCCDA